MSNPSDCQPCCATPAVVSVPGTEGEDGTGIDGVSSFTLSASAPGPFNKGDTGLALTVDSSAMFFVGQLIAIEDVNTTNAGYFQITAIPSSVSLTLTYLNVPANSNAASIATGKVVSPSGPSFTIGALPTALTDNSGGTQSNTIAAGVGIQTLAFYIEAATLANGDILTEYIPGYAFKILKFDARCAKTVSTGGKAASLNLEIGSTNLTGGVIALSGTYAVGAAQAGTAVTAANTGSATDSISIEASGVTAFTEGAFWLIISIQNTDSRDAIASLADHVNDLITALT